MSMREVISCLVPTGIKRAVRLHCIRKKLFGRDSGRYGKHIQSTAVSVSAKIDREAEIMDGVFIGDGVSVGGHTYIQSGSRVLSARIGRYCSIGTNCHIGMFEHPIGNISTSSRLYLRVLDAGDFYSDIPPAAIIGNDVWIGSGATVRGGVTVGNGAVIGAGAVVTKDIPPYAVAAGVPARVVKYRFSEEKIRELTETAWWDWDDETVRKNRELFFLPQQQNLKENKK